MQVRPVYPRDPGGGAEGLPIPAGPLALADLTTAPRFGLKGAGSAAWLAGKGAVLPAVNGIVEWRGMRLLRLGREDLLLLAEGEGGALAQTVSAWQSEPGPRGWSAWREEGWAWFRLSGLALDAAMARLCALDLRPAAFGANRIAQTRISGVEAVLFRSAAGFDILFDITLTAHVIGLIAAATSDLLQMEQQA